MKKPIIVVSVTIALFLSVLSCTPTASPSTPAAPTPVPTKPAPTTPIPASSQPSSLRAVVSERTQATVTRVIDGDTIDVDIGGRGYRVRYIGIDTPERDQIGYAEARLANAQLVSNGSVELENDVSETDKYDRLLRYVWVEEGMVNAILVASGFAQVSTYPPDVKYQAEFLELQKQAEQTGMGLLTAPKPKSRPKAELKQQTDVVYLGSVKSDKYHYPTCKYVGQINPENL
ncbi:MAG: thermonuclease family protein, partial [Anaerolineales bacterium]|nr:thermonuclease family protein [Anaerolineales bacterium]